VAWRKAEGNWHKSVLLEGIKDMRGRYFGLREDGTGPEWQSTWANRRSLPEAIELTIDFSPGDARQWPRLLIAPMITADAGCFTSPQGRDCANR